ncbi:MAG: VOC family protein [Betaproteobacteria bacterium]|nr:VOC family protein [Betaproteobacteria bacterium]
MQTTLVDPAITVTDARPTSRLMPKMLNHAAFVTHDAAATADFYIRIMGMEIAHTVVDDFIPSTETEFPFIHLFFRMGDGSTVAFFESPMLPPPAKSSHPVYDIFNHFAFQVNTREEVGQWKAWLDKNGVESRGPVDHDGQFLSLYFHDPAGIRLEVTMPTDPKWNRYTEEARRDLAYWVDAKDRARREGSTDPGAIVRWVREARETYKRGQTAA